MKVKILLNRIKVDVYDDFKKAGEYFKRHGLPIEWEFEQSNITGYKVENVNFGSVGYRLQITGHQDKISLSKDYITIFAFNGNEFPLKSIPTSKLEALPTGILLTLMTYKEGDLVGETYLTILHEMMHAINKLILFKGVNLEDPMDIMFRKGQWLKYYKNDQPEAPDSNFGEAWKIMKPHLNKLNTTPLVILGRTSDDGVQTLGEMVCTGFKCKTLERPWKNNSQNISCIPKGEYTCKYTFSPRLMRYTYEVLNVSGRSGIRLHKGNYFFDIEGCILLGDGFKDLNKDKKMDVTNSTVTLQKFEQFMNYKDFKLRII